MRKSAKSLLFGIGLILLYSIWSSLIRSPSVKDTPSSLNTPAADSEAALIIKGLHMTETKGDKLLWEIEADSAQVYQQQQSTQFKNIKLTLYQDQNPVLQLTGEEGGLDMNSRDVTIEGKVLARSQDGITFETNSLKWQNQTRLLYTPDPVKITKTNVLIQGRGLTADMALQKLNIQHEVTTIINYG